MRRRYKTKNRETARVVPTRLRYDEQAHDRLTHYLFRYPAKFHPPVAAALLRRFSKPGDVVLDLFCGSGTLLVEAKVLGRNAIGLDIDPVAVFVASVKTRHISCAALNQSKKSLLARIDRIRRREKEYERLQFKDIGDSAFKKATRRYKVHVPAIPNIFHWFRRYVVVDLARLRKAILTLRVPAAHKAFFMACFCSIIRNVSNADPVPVSGLEVTSHMKAKDAAGRVIDPFANYLVVLKRSLTDLEQFNEIAKSPDTKINVIHGDATSLRKYVRKKVDVVITSPPYHNAVDYYRRHTLEMYWLGLVSSHKERQQLLPRYIGRSRVPRYHPFVRRAKLNSDFARRCESMIRARDPIRADAFKHYAIAMQKCFLSLAATLAQRGKAIFVLGKSSWNGRRLPTVRLFQEFAAPNFRLIQHHWYPLSNRYMTYSRRNGANIDKEHVLVFQRISLSKGNRVHPSGSLKRNKGRTP